MVNDVCDGVLNKDVPRCSVIFTVRNKHMTNEHDVHMRIGPTTGQYIWKWNLDFNQAGLLVLDLFYHYLPFNVVNDDLEENRNSF